MKKISRSFLSGFCFAIFGLGGILTGSVIVPILLVFCTKSQQRKTLSFTIHILWKAFVSLMCFFRLISIKCDDMDKLQKIHGKIVVANHPSLIDVVILVAKIPNSICVVKESLFHNIFIKAIIRRVYVSNSMDANKFVKQASEILNAGYNIIIFPEGTRTISGKQNHLHRGFAYLHIESQHDILPIHIENTPKILGKNQAWYDVGDETSVYTLILRSEIQFTKDKNLNNRQSAINITKKAENAIF